MRRLRLFTAMLLLATMFIGFNACSSDDKDDEGKVEPKDKKVTKIVSEYKDDLQTESLEYSNGKLVKYRIVDNVSSKDKVNLSINYESNVVTMKGILNERNSVLTYTLSNGLATSCKITYSGEKLTENCTFQYSNGYLEEIFYTNSEGEEIYDEEIYKFIYSNGNISELAYSTNWSAEWEKDKESEIYTYSDELNKGGVLSPFVESILSSLWQKGAYHAGILGKPTKNLAISSIYKAEPKANGKKSTCVYSFDNEDYVKTATLSDGEKFTYTFE